MTILFLVVVVAVVLVEVVVGEEVEAVMDALGVELKELAL